MATSGSKQWKVGSSSLGGDAYIKFSWERISYSVKENTSTIKWKYQWFPDYWTIGSDTLASETDYQITIDLQEYSDSVTVTGPLRTYITVAEGTTVIPHDSTGKKIFTVNIYDSNAWKNETNVVTEFTLDDIPLPAELATAWDFTDEGTPRIRFIRRAEDSIIEACISFTGETDDIPYRVIEGGTKNTPTEYVFNLTESEREILRERLSEGPVVTVRYMLRTEVDGESYEVYLARTLTFVNYLPTLAPTVIATNNDRTRELTGDSSGNTLIKYYSDVEFSTNAEGRKGAYIENQYVRCGGQIVAGNMPEGTVEDVWSGDFEFNVTDSNGYTVQQTLNKTIVPYIKLTCSIDSAKLDNNGNLTFTIVGKYFNGSFGAKNNTFEVSYYLKENGEDMFEKDQPLGIVTPTVDAEGNYTYTHILTGLNYANKYELTVYVYDEITPANSIYTYTILGNVPIFDWGKEDFNFNVPVYLNNTNIPLERLADYIRIQGYSGNWFYRQWYSGKVELFGTQEISDLACNIALGGWYRTAVNSSPYFPFTIENPQVTVTYESDGYGALVWPTTSSSESRPFDYYLIRPTSSSGISGKLTFHVIGDQGAQIL